jgi:peptidyl-prolyl cis-trans isomerase C
MKVLALSVLCLGCAWAQAAAPQTPAPAAATLPDLPDTTPVAALDDGTVITMGDLKGLLTNLEPPARQAAVAHLPEFLNEWAMLHKVAQMALAEKLDEESPTKERLLWQRSVVLYDAELQQQANPPRIEGDEIEHYYDAHKSKYVQVKTDAIYIAFSNSAASQTGSDGKKILSEAEAKAKITGLLEQIRKGADFKKLARENSDDEISRAKDGVFATLTPDNTGIPDAIRTAVFALKAGETTEPIRQPNGFYLFRAEEVGFKPFSEVRDQVYSTIKTERLEKWMGDLHDHTKAKILNPAIK